MSATKRAARIVVAAVISIMLAGAATASALAAEGADELFDVSKTVADLSKKMDELRAHGHVVRKGELSAAAACGNDEPEPVFSAWGDESLYIPAPAGDLEAPEQWSLNKHAGLAENSPFGQGGASLFLGDHGEAISPAMCVSIAHPTIRMFVANSGGDDSRLEVEILYEGFDGKIKKLKVARLRGGPAWAPATVIPIYVNVLGAAAEDGLTAIAVRFKARDVRTKGGGWKLDDLYVDPLKTW
jgi:hypothetical protein